MHRGARALEDSTSPACFVYYSVTVLYTPLYRYTIVYSQLEHKSPSGHRGHPFLDSAQRNSAFLRVGSTSHMPESPSQKNQVAILRSPVNKTTNLILTTLLQEF